MGTLSAPRAGRLFLLAQASVVSYKELVASFVQECPDWCSACCGVLGALGAARPVCDSDFAFAISISMTMLISGSSACHSSEWLTHDSVNRFRALRPGCSPQEHERGPRKLVASRSETALFTRRWQSFLHSDATKSCRRKLCQLISEFELQLALCEHAKKNLGSTISFREFPFSGLSWLSGQIWRHPRSDGFGFCTLMLLSPKKKGTDACSEGN